MSRKLSGRNFLFLIVFGFSILVASCSEKIVGHPELTLKTYIDAVQKRDFSTMYNLNRLTARQKKFTTKGQGGGDINKALEENYQHSLEIYNSAILTFSPGTHWQEKFFFPPSATIKMGPPQNLKPVEKVMGENYEKGLKIQIKVSADYPKREEAPEYDGKKLRSLQFTCILSKLREPGTLMIYSQDPNWFFDGCVPELNTAEFAPEISSHELNNHETENHDNHQGKEH